MVGSNKVSKTYTITKTSPFIVKYRRELQIRTDIRRKEKIEKITEFVERLRKV